jgi:ATP-binding cassette subfamily B protein/ATP-binding cassette subfamily C protein
VIKKLNFLLTRQDKKFLFVLLVTVGITAIMPFISTASNPSLIDSNEYYKRVYDFFAFTSSRDFIVYFGLSLICFYIVRAFYIIFHSYLMSKFSMKKYSIFANKLFNNYLHMPYREFVNKNSATISKVIIIEAAQLAILVQNVLMLLSEIIIVIIIYTLLLVVDVKMTIVLTILLGIKVIILTKTVSKRIKIIGIEREKTQEKFNRMINETLGNFKVIKFISNQKSLMQIFSKISDKFATIQISNVTLSTIPRNVLEAIGLSLLILIVVYIVAFEKNISDVIPIVSMYAVALYRLLPAATRIISSYNNIVFFIPSLDIVYDELKCKYDKEEDKHLLFDKNITIKNLQFSYNEKMNVINNLTLEIKKGEKIAFIGESGSGKSTLIDLICGIYRPNSGKIFIDGVELDNSNIVSWRKKIGYIPQSIYLFDGTIADNVTFGRTYDKDKLVNILKQSNIYDLIMKKDGLNTMVGEGGIQLSGGQKQRIGIARALYGDPEILVLDEATSALDNETESKIMDEIYSVSKNKTLIVIAHRLSTIEKCDIKIDVGKLNE